MTEPISDENTEPTADAGVPAPPVTGHNGIDAALASLELGENVHEHPEQIADALDAITHALNPTPQPPLPRA